MGSIILIAPPAAGKGTMSQLLKEKYNIPHISTGDLLRSEVSKQTELGMELDKIMKSGAFVSDELILQVLSSNIESLDTYILDGFPRTQVQAEKYDEMLKRLNKKISSVIYIDTPKELTKQRIVSRVSCSKCGRVYNTSIEESMPKTDGICDYCGSSLVKREDDNEETFENRYQVYVKETEPLIEYYKKQNLLHTVDGNKNKQELFASICKIIEGEI